jgi:hypothetical protein
LTEGRVAYGWSFDTLALELFVMDININFRVSGGITISNEGELLTLNDGSITRTN